MEAQHEVRGPLLARRNPRRKTSAEIVSGARRALRAPPTRRPFTPGDAQRTLFQLRDGRPASNCSIKALDFDPSESRPGSGLRLPPLEHKPLFPSRADDAFRAPPRPPSDPGEARGRGQPGVRTRLLRRAGSLASLRRFSPDDGVKPAEEPEGLHDQTRRNPTAPRRTHSAGPSDTRVQPRTGLQQEVRNTSEDDEETWRNRILPLVAELDELTAAPELSSPQCVCEPVCEPVCECVCERVCERVCALCADLLAALTRADLLGRRCPGRNAILRTLYRLLHLRWTPLHLYTSRVCLALCVSGSNLLNICKLLYQISRNQENDLMFLKTGALDSLLDFLSREEVTRSLDALLYCAAALKFLSGSSALLAAMLERDGLRAINTVLQRLCDAEETQLAPAGHVLVQLTSILRNMADLRESRPLFVSLSVLPSLCSVLRRHGDDPEVCTNVSRIFSKLSSLPECRLSLLQTCDCYQLFLDLLNTHTHKQDLVVRLLFTLGNLTASSDKPRLLLYRCPGCVETLLRVYREYQRRRAASEGCHGDATREAEDVLVKLARLLANLCIHPEVGGALAADSALNELLMETLEQGSVSLSEELIVNVSVTVNNLSFYQQENSCVRLNRLHISELMLKLLLSSSRDVMLEAVRVYGNLSLSEDVRNFLLRNKVHLWLLALLDSSSSEVCFSTCGVLVNLSLDPPTRVLLAQQGAINRLLDCLRDLGAADWLLAAEVCRALWNLIGCCVGELQGGERESLLEVLRTLTDEALPWLEDEELKDSSKALWESEFLPAAQKLLKLL